MNFKKLLFFIVFLCLGGFLGYLFGNYGLGNIIKSLSISQLFTLLFLFIPIYFFVVGFHELGHAFFGKMMNFDFKMFVIGPFLFEKENSGLMFKWNKSFNLAGGLVVSLPSNDVNLKNRFSWYAAGGPLFSLFLVVFATFFYFLFSDINNFWAVIFQVIAFFSIIIFLATGIPFKSGSFHSDGNRILRLQRNSETSEFEVLFLKIIAQTNARIRPKNLNISDLNKAKELAIKTNDGFLVYIIGYLFQSYFDKGEHDQAEINLEEYILKSTEIPAAFQGMVWLDASFYYSFAKRDLELSKSYLEKFVPSNFIPKAQILVTEAMILILENDKLSALTKINEAKIQLPNMLDKGLALVYEERLAIMELETQI